MVATNLSLRVMPMGTADSASSPMPADLTPVSKVYQDQMTTASHGLALSNPPLIDHENPQLRPYPSFTTLQSNGSVYNASFMTSPSYDSLIEVRSYIAEMRHEDTLDTTSITRDNDLPPVDNVIKAQQASVITSASGPESSTFRAPRFHFHPILSHTRLYQAPISYDIAFIPTARTVVDRIHHSPFTAETLAQPATLPPIPRSSRLVLRSPKLPWVVVVGPISYIGQDDEKHKTKSSAALKNRDVIYAVHHTLMTCITHKEWDSLGERSRAQRRVAKAWNDRCTRMGGGSNDCVRRVDWLGSKTHFVGVEIDSSNEAGEIVGKLVFGRPSLRGGGTAAAPGSAASPAEP